MEPRTKTYLPRQIEKIWWAAFYFASRHQNNMGVEPEDFSAFVVEIALQGKTFQLRYLWVDFLRSWLGRSNQAAGLLKMQTHFNPVSLDQCFEEAKEPEKSLSWGDLATRLNLSERDRVLLILDLKWEMSRREIAEVLGVHPSRVSQLNRDLRIKIEKRLKKLEPAV